MNGWIKLHRKFIEWEWYKDINTKVIFLHLLLKANHKDQKWQGLDIKRGQLITGRKSISLETGISEQSIRTSLNKLKSTNEITIHSNNKNSIITILNYDLYQNESEDNQQLTSNQPATNQQLTTNNNDNNDNNTYSEPDEKKYVGKPTEDPQEAINLTNEIASYFDVSEKNNFHNYKLIGNFVRKNLNDDKLDYLKSQFYAYKEVTSKFGFKHSIKNYIGEPKERYEDGAWCEKDWTNKQPSPSKVLPPRQKRINPS